MLREALERIKNGKPLFLYRSVYIPVDSEINGEPIAYVFDTAPIKLYGQLGWDVAATIPKTVGIALCNRTLGTNLQTFGAGMGGNVVGVHILLRKELKDPLTQDETDELKRSIASIPPSL